MCLWALVVACLGRRSYVVRRRSYVRTSRRGWRSYVGGVDRASVLRVSLLGGAYVCFSWVSLPSCACFWVVVLLAVVIILSCGRSIPLFLLLIVAFCFHYHVCFRFGYSCGYGRLGGSYAFHDSVAFGGFVGFG